MVHERCNSLRLRSYRSTEHVFSHPGILNVTATACYCKRRSTMTYLTSRDFSTFSLNNHVPALNYFCVQSRLEGSARLCPRYISSLNGHEFSKPLNETCVISCTGADPSRARRSSSRLFAFSKRTRSRENKIRGKLARARDSRTFLFSRPTSPLPSAKRSP